MVKHKNLNAIISTEGGNNYYVGRSIPQVLLMHPVLKHLVALKEEGKLEEWLNNQQPNETGEIKIEDGIYASPKDIRYYCRYLQFLEEKNYFAGVEKYDMTPTRYSAADVKKTLANCGQIVFEATEACNLNCKYCGFGEFYSGFGKRRNRTLDLDAAVKVTKKRDRPKIMSSKIKFAPIPENILLTTFKFVLAKVVANGTLRIQFSFSFSLVFMLT